MTMRYANRHEAGRLLAGRLKQYSGEETVVVGLPRGGVEVAAEVATVLGCDLDIIMAGKLRAPYNPELAIGAVTEDGLVYLNADAIRSLRIPPGYIDEEKKARLETMRERLALYRKVKPKVDLGKKTVVIVDDGLATGSTMISAIQAATACGAARIIVAVPGGPTDTVAVIKAMDEVAEVVCPAMPEPFFAVSQLYEDFRQVEDFEVIEILRGFVKKQEIRR